MKSPTSPYTQGFNSLPEDKSLQEVTALRQALSILFSFPHTEHSDLQFWVYIDSRQSGDDTALQSFEE